MADAVRINGNLFSWGSITAKVNGEAYTGFSKISYGDSRERTKGYGMGRAQAPRGRSRGKYATDPVALTGFKDSVQELRAALARLASDGKSYGSVEFELVVQYVDEGETPITVVLEQCVWTKDASSEEEGPDPLVDTVEIDCMRVKRNGLYLYDGTTA